MITGAFWNKNVLITGGAGYLGTALVQKLIAAKTTWSGTNMEYKKENRWSLSYNKLTVYDNLMYKQVPLMNYCYKDDFEFVYGDVRDDEKLRKQIEDADIIFPLAALVGAPACDKDPHAARAINTKHIETIMFYKKPEAIVVYPNTNSGYGIGQKDIFCTEETPLNPISLYGVTKCLAEDKVLSGGGVSLRLATVFGVSQRMRLDLLVNDFTYKALTDKYIVLFEHAFKRNYIHVQDVALTFIFAAQNHSNMKGQAYNVGLSNANLSKLELAQAIAKYTPFSIQLDDIAQDIDKRDYIVSNAKLEKLGWKPYYDLETGIQELIKAYKILIPSNKPYTNV